MMALMVTWLLIDGMVMGGTERHQLGIDALFDELDLNHKYKGSNVINVKGVCNEF